MSDDTTSTTIKPGYRTTEFWVSVAAMALTALYAGDIIPTSGLAATIAGIAATVLTGLGYKVSRALVKAACVLLVLGMVVSTQACAGRAAATAGAGALLDCEAPEIQRALPDVLVLAERAVLAWVSGDGAIDAAGIKSDASRIRDALGRCAFDAAIAALTAAVAPSSAGSPQAAELAIDRVQVTATWRAVRAELGWPVRR